MGFVISALTWCGSTSRRPPFGPYYLVCQSSLARRRRTQARRVTFAVFVVVAAGASQLGRTSVYRRKTVAVLPSVATVLKTVIVLAGLLVPAFLSVSTILKVPVPGPSKEH